MILIVEQSGLFKILTVVLMLLKVRPLLAYTDMQIPTFLASGVSLRQRGAQFSIRSGDISGPTGMFG